MSEISREEAFTLLKNITKTHFTSSMRLPLRQ